MKATEFCYWLQGYFELSLETDLTPHQVEMIKRHLKMVKLHDRSTNKAREFCDWLVGAIDIFQGAAIASEHVDVISKKLHEIFKHEIDPSYPESSQLSYIHNPVGSGGGLQRC